ncbi:transcriptional regulator [Aeromonas encheleia]|uniref:cupin domain-containing protein n=1 Tax=Aeromonas encheleia TaxID=73010 RepID=UPI0005B23434|nr:cupin domain-containing protein [Aeromonas encheleia]UNP89868.1 cupin domain-containing protein [Aeromonas encheleia]VEG96884.1 transcriptional regulator [Aeromonas encheleia]
MKNLNDWILLDQHPVSPTPLTPPSDRIRAGNPSQTLWNHYSDPSQQFHVGFWACEPGRWAVHYTEHEYCQLLEGEARIHDGQGGQLHLKAGDQFVIPAGFVGEWETLIPCRKLYVIFEPAAA